MTKPASWMQPTVSVVRRQPCRRRTTDGRKAYLAPPEYFVTLVALTW